MYFLEIKLLLLLYVLYIKHIDTVASFERHSKRTSTNLKIAFLYLIYLFGDLHVGAYVFKLI